VRALALSLVLLSTGVLAGPATAPPRTLAVAAAANLKDVVQALKAAFEAAHPGVTVQLSLGASGTFFSQIQNGAPFDLFLSADRDYPRKLVEAGLGAAADERVYALGRLVAWLPPGSTLTRDLDARGLEALAGPQVKRIAIANPAVAPFGRAAMRAFEAAGVARAVEAKLVKGTSVAQAAQFATTGAADVAFIPASLTLGPELGDGAVVPVPEALCGRLEQSGLVLTGAREPALARAFLEFLTGAEGRSILAARRYGLP
jgi:molybdate transport system substrate-binding protein